MKKKIKTSKVRSRNKRKKVIASRVRPGLRQQQIVHFVKMKGKVTLADIHAFMDKRTATKQKWPSTCALLCERGLLKRKKNRDGIFEYRAA